jgi:hypothetical protein
MVDTYFYDDWAEGQRVAVADVELALSEEAAARRALDGAFRFFGDWCRPLAVDVDLTTVSEDYEVEDERSVRSSWFVRRRPLPPLVEPESFWNDAIESDDDVFTADTLFAVVQRALGQAPPDGHAVAWQSLQFRAMEVRLPEGVTEVCLTQRWGGRTAFPVEEREDGFWVAAPARGTPSFVAPLTFEVGPDSQQGTPLWWESTAWWSLWAGLGEPGDADLDAAFARLRAFTAEAGPEHGSVHPRASW